MFHVKHFLIKGGDYTDNVLTWASSFVEAVSSNTAMLSVAAIGITAIIGRLAFGIVKRFTGR